MTIVWDPTKAKANLRKHGIRFSDAEGVLFDPNAFTEEDENVDGEQRFVSIGLDPLGRLLVIIYMALPEIVWVLGRTSVVPKGVPSFVRRGVGR
jgi:hypothetical protein